MGTSAGEVNTAFARYEVYELYLSEGMTPGEVLRRRLSQPNAPGTEDNREIQRVYTQVVT
jgi:hypothetical protein